MNKIFCSISFVLCRLDKRMLTLLLLFGNNFILYGQHSILVVGSDSLSLTGSISFSIGQIDYISTENSSIIISEGIQQPFEIYIKSMLDENDKKSLVQVYPNPTNNFIEIGLNEASGIIASYKFFDINGKQLQEDNIFNNQSSISLAQFSNGLYFLKVFNDERQEIKVFKIIKNQ